MANEGFQSGECCIVARITYNTPNKSSDADLMQRTQASSQFPRVRLPTLNLQLHQERSTLDTSRLLPRGALKLYQLVTIKATRMGSIQRRVSHSHHRPLKPASSTRTSHVPLAKVMRMVSLEVSQPVTRKVLQRLESRAVMAVSHRAGVRK
jgi:hypothetical protein